ncbi:Uncharacterized protein CTA2_11596 [Colletotrichum tanaceti]|uniref:Thioesterase atnL n=1 Tax=Colletotrichum tanaceti TaxID=1306861 RepID=A0A4U6X4U2_9PEZI|nr:Uncharacterized protein CTA2_11596 [Colletotrichum tanaceti]TKW49963.1 Uncharacterized protein CTA1_11192 [Colletotrichum tanaceti]
MILSCLSTRGPSQFTHSLNLPIPLSATSNINTTQSNRWRQVLPQGQPLIMASALLHERLADLLETAARPASIRAIQQAVLQWVAAHKGQTAWGAVTAALLYLNLKRFPLVWHLRVFRSIWWPRKGHFGSGPGSVFRPVVTPSRVSLLESDYNLHKSNSTYFSDLDVGRTDLLAALRAEAARGGLYREHKGGVMVLLAGTSCVFKKEIKPGAAFDMHSRILTWDKKWLYVVTHFVERRSPSESHTSSYQPWKPKKPEGDDKSTASRSPVVFATAISKCVVKAGRLTVAPEKFLQAAGVLVAAATTESESEAHGHSDDEPSGADGNPGDGHGHGPDPAGDEGWTWARVEEERLRALSMADGFASGLDAAHEEFYALG